MQLPTLADIESAARTVYAAMPPTPQYRWPLLCEQLGTEVWTKHENHTPTGAFKVRGGLTYFETLAVREPACTGVISATCGNHGQSVGFAARAKGIAATIVVPHGNSKEKNAAMRALGVTLIEHGDDFQAAREHAQALGARDGLHSIPSFHADLLSGVATYWWELLRAVPDLDVIYVPIGMGSGFAALAAARAALGSKSPKVEIVGVVSAHAPAYALSFAAGRPVNHPSTTQISDGTACTTPDADAVAIVCAHAARIVQVDDAAVRAAMKSIYQATHNVAEGAGAIAWAAALQERERLKGKRVAWTLCGGNVDADVFAEVLR